MHNYLEGLPNVLSLKVILKGGLMCHFLKGCLVCTIILRVGSCTIFLRLHLYAPLF